MRSHVYVCVHACECESYTLRVYHMNVAELTDIEVKQEASLVSQVWYHSVGYSFK